MIKKSQLTTEHMNLLDELNNGESRGGDLFDREEHKLLRDLVKLGLVRITYTITDSGLEVAER